MSCSGCGAAFQMNSIANPGYVDYNSLNDRMILNQSSKNEKLIYIKASILKESSPLAFSMLEKSVMKPSSTSFPFKALTRLEIQRIENRIKSDNIHNSSDNIPNKQEAGGAEEAGEIGDSKRIFENISDPSLLENEECWNEYLNNMGAITKSELKNHDKKSVLICHRCHSLRSAGRWNTIDFGNVHSTCPNDASIESNTDSTEKAIIDRGIILPLSDKDRKFINGKLNDNSIMIMVVNSLDLPHSIIPNLWQLLSTECRPRLVVVANKWDLMPFKGHESMQKWKKRIEKMLKNAGLVAEEIHFSSAKKGWNIEDLISTVTKLLNGKDGDVFIVGKTNVGKSSLYNSLSLNDHDNGNDSTIGSLHGTTIGILKKKMVNVREAIMKMKNEKNVNRLPAVHPDSWLYDLPGILMNDHRDIVSSYLTFEEAESCVIKHSIKSPHKHILRSGESFLISGLIRIDCIDEGKSIEMEIFMHPKLSFMRKQTRNVDLFLKSNLGIQMKGQPSLRPPFIERNKKQESKQQQPKKEREKDNTIVNEQIISFPEFKESQRIHTSQNKTIDVVFLGDLGWISFKATNNDKDGGTAIIYTPNGIGTIIRDES